MVQKREFAACAALALVLLSAPRLLAEKEPYLAVRTGLKCSACHVNRTGGGMRNDFGAVYAGGTLPMTTEGFRFQNRALNDFIKMGADFRLSGSALLSSATARDGAPRTSLNIKRANLYVEAKLIEDKLTLYFDETLAPGGATSREFFALLDIPGVNGYAKVGTFFLPSGLRILDDQEFIRQVTGFTMLAPDQGVEVGIEPGPFSIFASVTNGSRGATENNSGKQVTGTAAWISRRFRLGASASRNTQGGLHTDVLGGFGGLNVGKLSLLGEVDYVQGASGEGRDVDQVTAYGAANFLIRKGVNAKATYGFHDRDVDRPEDERIRARFGLELFPFPYLQVSGFYVIRDDIPEGLSLALPQRDEVFIELHLLF
ncbi:MAG: hypothetical protein IID06_09395 [Gemmatimonadetes bacterium]|nr:hypothetical protein [Gemmatimonadota bacterium]